MNGYIRVERQRARLTVTLDHQPTRNALTAPLAAELQAVLNEAAADRTLQTLILRGANGSFCAGADLKTALTRMEQPVSPGEPDPVAADNRHAGLLFQSLNSHPQTVIAIVDGPAFGGGFGLACCADIVICTSRARFALSETGLGLPPAQIAPYVVSRLGLRTTRRLALTGLRFDGREAAAIGLADYFCETEVDLEVTLTALLKGIGRCAPGANAVTKDLLLSLSPAGGDAYLDRAAAAFATCLRSAEGREGVAAFNGKRAANWVDDLS
jgi:isohexenylglutaconyl-CoA hydratase